MVKVKMGLLREVVLKMVLVFIGFFDLVLCMLKVLFYVVLLLLSMVMFKLGM